MDYTEFYNYTIGGGDINKYLNLKNRIIKTHKWCNKNSYHIDITHSRYAIIWYVRWYIIDIIPIHKNAWDTVHNSFDWNLTVLQDNLDKYLYKTIKEKSYGGETWYEVNLDKLDKLLIKDPNVDINFIRKRKIKALI
jgi:hypothetical protein